MEKPWKVIMAFVGVFIAGSVFGGLLALRISKQGEVAPRLSQIPVTMPAPGTGPAPTLPPSGPAGSPHTLPPPAGPRPNNPPAPQMVLPANMAVQAPQLMRRYVEKLDLTGEQKDRVNPLIQRATGDLRRQQQTNFRETGIIIQRLQEDLAKELTPAQRGRLEEMTRRQQELILQKERAQQELQRLEKEKQRGQKGPKADKPGGKAKVPPVKPVDDGNN